MPATTTRKAAPPEPDATATAPDTETPESALGSYLQRIAEVEQSIADLEAEDVALRKKFASLKAAAEDPDHSDVDRYVSDRTAFEIGAKIIRERRDTIESVIRSQREAIDALKRQAYNSVIVRANRIVRLRDSLLRELEVEAPRRVEELDSQVSAARARLQQLPAEVAARSEELRSAIGVVDRDAAVELCRSWGLKIAPPPAR